MFEVDQHKVLQGLVMLAIEKSLLDYSSVMYDKVLNHLEKKYKKYLVDCYEHPEYLKSTINELYSKSYYDIVDRITTELLEFSYQKQVKQFLVSINPRLLKNMN